MFATFHSATSVPTAAGAPAQLWVDFPAELAEKLRPLAGPLVHP